LLNIQAKKEVSLAGEPTPLMRQYLREKEKYPDSVLLFRVGDFYEMFYEDAVIASEALGLVLTSRDKNKKNPIPLCGVPYHALKTYLSRLLDKGFKVAVCEQVEDPKTAKGVVKRAVTLVVTPGLILDEDQLEAKLSNYISSLVADPEGNGFGLAMADISTGEFKVARLATYDDAAAELARIRPRQVLVTDQVKEKMVTLLPTSQVLWEPIDQNLLSLALARKLISKYSLSNLPKELKADVGIVLATAALIKALMGARPEDELPPVRIIPYVPSEFLILDDSTINNLELFETIRDRRKEGSVISVLDKTVTAMGGRKLRHWMLYPLMDIQKIEERLDGVEVLISKEEARDQLRSVLRTLPDLERLASRILHGVATPRDLGVLLRGLIQVPELHQVVDSLWGENDKKNDLLSMGDDHMEEVVDLLSRALVDEPPVYLKDGGVFKKGYDSKLDKLIDLSSGGKRKILEIEQREKENTGIPHLKIKYNRVFGYYIEIPRSRMDAVPDYYVRKQTLRNSERYVTQELAEHETLVLSAEEKRVSLENELFLKIRDSLALLTDRLKDLGSRVATSDALSGLAEVAHRRGYSRPKVSNSDKIQLKNARHPVIEAMLKPGEFIPNDTTLSSSNRQISIITGPNMSGKSTIIRQVALNILMAQMGSFVPADKATIGICDRIFSRVGASDNIAKGESTFMVEMKETANILSYATSKSMVILDEIGRGTSTYDGVSIAWSVVEHLHDKIGCKTLFATHYHELTALTDVKPRVFNAGVAVKEHKGNILFLRKLMQGSVNRSYGIQVAGLAGVPNSVITRAKTILKALEEGDSLTVGASKKSDDQNQMSLFTPSAPKEEPSPVDELMKTVDPDTLSPRDALNLIYELKSLT
jgi:DNA mismatch repair protein MutS